MPHNPFPDPAAVHPGEAEMLAAVLANLTDDLPKLVYADWLEERRDDRGPFLRAFVTAARRGGKLPRPKKVSKAWLDLVGVRAVMAVRQLDPPLPLAPDDFLRDALPGLTFTSKKVKDTTIPVGASKFGGDPDVQAKFRWPRYDDDPLGFLAQFDLAELSVSPVCRDLPPDGLLSVFYARSGEVFESSDKGGWKVYHFPAGELTRRTPPDDLAAEDRTPACRLVFTETLSLLDGSDIDGLDAFGSVYEQSVRRSGLCHHLLGRADWLQGSADWSHSMRKGKPKYRHLLTLDGDKNAGWTWGDAGLLYFGISADDLKTGRFDRTVFEMQCC